MTFQQFLTESDDFILAWNAYANKNPEAAPLPSQYKRFSKISSTKSPSGIYRGCFHNSWTNFKEKGWKMVVGLAVPHRDVETLFKTGEISWNPKYRGYIHAWNIDKNGAIIDSTYKNPEEYRYYGMVVPDVTAKSFSNDSEIEDYIYQINDAHGQDKRQVSSSKKPLITIQQPLPSPFKEILDGKKLIFHSVETDRDGAQTYLYIKKGDSGIKVHVGFNHKTQKIERVSQESVIHDRKHNVSGPGPFKVWRGEDALRRWANNFPADFKN